MQNKGLIHLLGLIVIAFLVLGAAYLFLGNIRISKDEVFLNFPNLFNEEKKEEKAASDVNGKKSVEEAEECVKDAEKGENSAVTEAEEIKEKPTEEKTEQITCADE